MPGILVTGASGFLGRSICKQLAEQGLPYLAASRQARPGWVQLSDGSPCPASEIIVHTAEEPDRAKVNQLGAAYIEHSAGMLRQLLARTQRPILEPTTAAQTCRWQAEVREQLVVEYYSR